MAFEVLGKIARVETIAEGREIRELQRLVRERLSAYAYPRKLEFVDDLPKTLTGKIRRAELRKADSGDGEGNS